MLDVYIYIPSQENPAYGGYMPMNGYHWEVSGNMPPRKLNTLVKQAFYDELPFILHLAQN
jgi:hypothetical protein